MKVAPFRALTHLDDGFQFGRCFLGRNEGRPIQGIDTHGSVFRYILFNGIVEMKVAPFRVLTLLKPYLKLYS